MGVFLRCAAFGLFWFGLLWITLLIIGSGLAGSTVAGKHAPPPGAVVGKASSPYGPDASQVAGLEFRDRYGTIVLLTAALLATTGTIFGVLPGTRRR